MTCSEAWTTMSATSRRTPRRADSRSRSISLAGTLDDAVALLAGLPLGSLALGLGLLAGVLEDLTALATGLLDLAPVLGQELARLGARLLGLVNGAFDLGLPILDLLADRRVDVPDEQEQQDEEGYDLPEDQAGIAQVEDARWV